MLPVEVKLPELICLHGSNPLVREQDKSVGDLSLIAFYYILRWGESFVKATSPDKKQTVKFRVKDVTLFNQDVGDVFWQLPHNSLDWMLMFADSATMNISNQKNEKKFCTNHASNGNKELYPVRELARLNVSKRKHSGNPSIFSAYFQEGKRHDVNNSNISTAWKRGAAVID